MKNRSILSAIVSQKWSATDLQDGRTMDRKNNETSVLGLAENEDKNLIYWR